MAAIQKLEELLPPEQIKQLANLLGPVMGDGYGQITLIVERHQVRFFRVTRDVRAAAPVKEGPGPFLSRESGHA